MPAHLPRNTGHVRVPAFTPVPLRTRSDGWTPERQARFLAGLAQGNSVELAARMVGRSRETAYRLRRRPGAGGFAAAWDRCVGRKAKVRRKVTPEERVQRVRVGLLKPRIFRREYVGLDVNLDNRALISLWGQFARSRRRKPRRDAEGPRFGRLLLQLKSVLPPQRHASR